MKIELLCTHEQLLDWHRWLANSWTLPNACHMEHVYWWVQQVAEQQALHGVAVMCLIADAARAEELYPIEELDQ